MGQKPREKIEREKRVGGWKGIEEREKENKRTRKKTTPKTLYCSKKKVMLKKIKLTSTNKSECKKIKYNTNRNKNSPKINEVLLSSKERIEGKKNMDNNRKGGVKKLFIISWGQGININMKRNKGMYRDGYPHKGNDNCSKLLLFWRLYFNYGNVVLWVLKIQSKELTCSNWLRFIPENEVPRRGYRIRSESIYVRPYEGKISEKRAARNNCYTVIKCKNNERKIRRHCYEYVGKNLYYNDGNWFKDIIIKSVKMSIKIVKFKYLSVKYTSICKCKYLLQGIFFFLKDNFVKKVQIVMEKSNMFFENGIFHCRVKVTATRDLYKMSEQAGSGNVSGECFKMITLENLDNGECGGRRELIYSYG
jgi:hypothetical protein